MFKNTFQSGFLSILYSIGSKPLQIWDKEGAWLRQNVLLGLANGCIGDRDALPREGVHIG